MKDELPRWRPGPDIRRRPTRLDEDKVREIKQALADGAPVRELALRYGVTASMIRLIRSGAHWSWVK